jgi:glutaredoxin
MKRQVTLYTRAGCCLCDDAKQAIEEARTHAEFDYQEVDIDLDPDPDLQRLYNDDVPVILINGIKAFKHRVSVPEFLKRLAART